MIGLGILFYFFIIILVTLFHANIAILIDAPSLLLILGANVAILIATGSFKDFMYGIQCCISKNTVQDKKKLLNSIEAFKLLFKTSVSSGFIGMLIGFISMLHNLSNPSSVGPYISIILLSALYGIVFAFAIILPILFVLEKLRRNMD